MAWLAIDKDGLEYIFDDCPVRKQLYNQWWNIEYDGNCIHLPKGTIAKLLGYELTWEDDPVKLK
jgi:hypothetical protein